MKRLFFAMCLTCLYASALFADDAVFGSKKPGLLNLKGTIYFLPTDTPEMPADIEKQLAQGVIYADSLNIPLREFTEGFPGITNRFEWFGLLYTGTFEIVKAGLYKWRLDSDDGSRLWLDGTEVINNDGVHGMSPTEGERELSAGRHTIKVWYFQGPANEIGLQLFITPPGAEEKIFSLTEFSAGLSKTMQDINARATKEGIRIQLDAQILFDTNKFDLKPTAAETIQKLARVIGTYPNCLVKMEGHTDNVGSDDANLKLSGNRANSVKDALIKANVPAGIRFETIGYGETQPMADNNTEKGRAKNRRVEILIVP